MQLTPSVLTVTGWTLQSDILNKTSRAPDTITAPFAVRITAAWLNAVASLDTPVILSKSHSGVREAPGGSGTT